MDLCSSNCWQQRESTKKATHPWVGSMTCKTERHQPGLQYEEQSLRHEASNRPMECYRGSWRPFCHSRHWGRSCPNYPHLPQIPLKTKSPQRSCTRGLNHQPTRHLTLCSDIRWPGRNGHLRLLRTSIFCPRVAIEQLEKTDYMRFAHHTACISTVTVDPALTGHLAPTALVPALHRISLLPTLVTGLLLWGIRTHWEPCMAS
jgi:hypothetical protein